MGSWSVALGNSCPFKISLSFEPIIDFQKHKSHKRPKQMKWFDILWLAVQNWWWRNGVKRCTRCRCWVKQSGRRWKTPRRLSCVALACWHANPPVCHPKSGEINWRELNRPEIESGRIHTIQSRLQHPNSKSFQPRTTRSPYTFSTGMPPDTGRSLPYKNILGFPPMRGYKVWVSSRTWPAFSNIHWQFLFHVSRTWTRQIWWTA